VHFVAFVLAGLSDVTIAARFLSYIWFTFFIDGSALFLGSFLKQIRKRSTRGLSYPDQLAVQQSAHS
jgi:hypothetical protein